VFCTLEISRRHLCRLPDDRLETVAERLLGPLPQDTRPHRALGDVRIVAMVWVALGEEMKEQFSAYFR
jgi:DNA polymerase-3 subunit epsilon